MKGQRSLGQLRKQNKFVLLNKNQRLRITKEPEQNKLTLESELKSLQARIDADRTLAEEATSHTNLHVPDENRDTKAARTRIRCPTLNTEKDDIKMCFFTMKSCNFSRGWMKNTGQQRSQNSVIQKPSAPCLAWSRLRK